MFQSFKKIFTKIAKKSDAAVDNQNSLLFKVFIKLLEDVLWWRKLWLSLYVIVLFHVVFFVCVYQQTKSLSIVFCLSASVMCMDALETWLKYKHRTSFLKTLANPVDGNLNMTTTSIRIWFCKRHFDFLCLRESNHTKAYLLVNIGLGILLIIGRYVNCYLLVYTLCMLIFFMKLLAPPVLKLARKIQQSAESDGEIEGFMPEMSEGNIKLLSLEPDQNEDFIDEKQILEWKPEGVPIDDSSDSSETSSSLVTNLLAAEKSHNFGRDTETSDSGEDEYIPSVQQTNQFKSTLEVVQTTGTWSNSAYSAFKNLTGAVVNMISQSSTDAQKKQVSRKDSSDGFEIIDENDLK